MMWDIAAKDLRLLARDRRALAVLIAFPLIFIAILGISTGRLMGWKAGNEMLQLSVVMESTSPVAQQIVDTLASREGLEVRTFDKWEPAVESIDGRTAAVRIGDDFAAKLKRLQLRHVLEPESQDRPLTLDDLSVTFRGQPGWTTATIVLEQLVFAATMRAIVPHVARRHKLVARLLDRENRLAKEGDKPPRADGDDGPTTIPERSTVVYQQLVPAFTVMFAFLLVNIMARSFLAERSLGTFRRLQTSPISAASIIGGKTLPFLLISIAQCSALFLFGRLLFGMSWGERPLLLIPVLLCMSCAATSLGLLIAVLVRTDAQVSAYANLVVISMAGISGCFMPRAWLPDVMQWASLATPHAWSLLAFDNLLKTAAPDPLHVAQCCGMLLVFTVAFGGLGYRQFGRFANDESAGHQRGERLASNGS